MIDYAAEYDNSSRVGNSAALIERYAVDAGRFRDHKSLVADFNMAYGPSPRNQMDIFWPRNKAGKERSSPLVMFIHGGYWQNLDRASFSHLAKGLIQNGIAVAMPSYTLCPDIKIDGIINEIRRACLALYQTHQRKITVVGHSAGGHLAACAMATDWEQINRDLPPDMVCSGMGISGLYDLIPILYTPINDAVRMDRKQAISASPIRWLPEALQRFEAWVGEHESDEYHRQSKDLADRWTMLGTPTKYVSVDRTNHFTIINDLTDPESKMVERIVDLVQNPEAEVKIKEPREKAIEAMLQDFARLPAEPIPERVVAKAKIEEAKTKASSTEDKPVEEPQPKTSQTQPPEKPADKLKPAKEEPAKFEPPKKQVAEAKPAQEKPATTQKTIEAEEKSSGPSVREADLPATKPAHTDRTESKAEPKPEPDIPEKTTAHRPATANKPGATKKTVKKTPATKAPPKKAAAKRKPRKKTPKSIVTRKPASGSKTSSRKKPADKSNAKQEKTTPSKET